MSFEKRKNSDNSYFILNPTERWINNALNWIDKNLPTCPFCKKNALWETRIEYKLSLNRYQFRCTTCKSIISISVAAVTGFSVFRDKSFRIENVGVEGSLKSLAGTKRSLKTFQEMGKC